MSDNINITINGGNNIMGGTLIGATFVTNNNFVHTPAETPQTARPITEIEEAEEVTDPARIPDCLDTPEAHDLLAKLVQAGLLDEHWQPCGLSIAERGELAATVAERLGLKAHWQLFGKLWGDNPETLRTGCSKAQDKRKILAFKDTLKQALA